MRPYLYFFIAFTFFSVEPGVAATITVCDICPVQTVESAIDLASPHDTLVFEKGLYTCRNIEISKPITLLGQPGAILDGKNESYLLKLLSDSIHISGFELTGSGKSYTHDFAGIYAYRIANFSITNNDISNVFFGFLIEKSKRGLIANNTFKGTAQREDESGNGIHLWHCQEMSIRSNRVQGMRDGIYLEFVDDSEVIDNYTTQNVRYGLHFMFSNRDRYADNTFEDNGAGVAVMFSKWIEMENNRFLNNWGTASYGLLLKEIYDAEVKDNLFEQNTSAIFIDGSTRINYKGNTFRQNGWAIKVSGGCYQNEFTQNNFISNSFDVSYNSKVNDNRFVNNFWSDYNGYDINKDGVGDIPYRPVKLFSYVVNRTPETIVLLRSLFVDIINFSEKVSPVFTPDDLQDEMPSIRIFL